MIDLLSEIVVSCLIFKDRLHFASLLFKVETGAKRAVHLLLDCIVKLLLGGLRPELATLESRFFCSLFKTLLPFHVMVLNTVQALFVLFAVCYEDVLIFLDLLGQVSGMLLSISFDFFFSPLFKFLHFLFGFAFVVEPLLKPLGNGLRMLFEDLFFPLKHIKPFLPLFFLSLELAEVGFLADLR